MRSIKPIKIDPREEAFIKREMRRREEDLREGRRLLPCPFCGYARLKVEDIDTLGAQSVVCYCGAEGPSAGEAGEDEAGDRRKIAIEWNTRTVRPELVDASGKVLRKAETDIEV